LPQAGKTSIESALPARECDAGLPIDLFTLAPLAGAFFNCHKY
jgi:hypothetical protein